MTDSPTFNPVCIHTYFDVPMNYFNIEYREATNNYAKAALYLGGVVYTPIYLCSKPVTFVADIISGIFQFIYCVCAKKGLPTAGETFFKVSICSPLQQLQLTATMLGGPLFKALDFYKEKVLPIGSYAGMFLLFIKLPLQIVAFGIDAVKVLSSPKLSEKGFYFLNIFPNFVAKLINNNLTNTVAHVAGAFFLYSAISSVATPMIAAASVLLIASLAWKTLYAYGKDFNASLTPSLLTQNIFAGHQSLGFTGRTYLEWAQIEAQSEIDANRLNRLNAVRSSSNLEILKELPKLPSDHYNWRETDVNPVYNAYRDNMRNGRKGLNLFGLPEDATKASIESEYLRAIKFIHPQKLPLDATPELKAEANEIFNRLTREKDLLISITRPNGNRNTDHILGLSVAVSAASVTPSRPSGSAILVTAASAAVIITGSDSLSSSPTSSSASLTSSGTYNASASSSSHLSRSHSSASSTSSSVDDISS